MPVIIFVDDSETALASTKMVVSSLPVETHQFLSAQEALNAINGGTVPDLIVTDLNMPEMNGFEFLEALRTIDSVKRVPVLMLTTETSDDMKAQGKALGLTGWIVKPFNPTQLKSAITRVLRLDA
ncbi:MAG: response regulator [Thiovulaceae bacterium]|nr:response regulator [Sulfurimonadaceae bacterium]